MAVYVYSTGSVQKLTGATATASVNVNNRTTETQTVRIAFFDTTTGAKTVISPPGGNQPYTILANTDLNTALLIPTGVTKFEVEIRLPNPHFSSYILLTGASEPSFKAGQMFFDSSQTENP